MVLTQHGDSGSSDCSVLNQDQPSVQGQSNYKWTSCRFACFKY